MCSSWGDESPPDPEWEWREWGLPPPPPCPLRDPLACAPSCALADPPPGSPLERAALPAMPLVAVCASLVVMGVLLGLFFFWRHKTKVSEALPSKSEQGGPGANGLQYDESRHTRLPPHNPLLPLEILDVKLGTLGPPQISSLPPCYPPSGAPATRSLNPVYEEVLQPAYQPPAAFPGSGQCSASSSVRGSTGGDLSRDAASSDEGDCDFNSFGYPRTAYPERTARHNGTRPLHSRPQKDSHRHMSPPAIPSSFVTRDAAPSPFVTKKGGAAPSPFVSREGGGRWMPDDLQENIYSTIDEDEYPVHHPASLAPRGSPRKQQTKRRGERGDPSYGDMLPACHPSAFL